MNKKKWLKFGLFALLFVTAITIGILGQTQKATDLSPKNQTLIQDQGINPSSAQQNKAEAKKEEQEGHTVTGSMLEYFNLGGPFMWPLLLFSIIVLGVLIERTYVYSKLQFKVSRIGQSILTAVKAGDIAGAKAVCQEHKKNVAADIFEKALPLIQKSAYDFEKSVESSSIVKVAQLEKNLNIFSTMGNLAPLTGFLGTVSGMISAFKTIALADNVTAKLVAGGIYEALITTEVGLVIAILAVGVNNFFVHKIDSSVNQIQELTDRIIEQSKKG